MTTVLTLQSEIALQIRDTGLAEITSAQIITALNSAARDAENAGWLIPLSDNTSLTYTTLTLQYSVPASFAFIKDLLDDGAVIGQHYWQMRTISSVPKFVFDAAADIRIAAGSVLTVIGYRKPTTAYAATSETVDAGMEAFLSARAASKALQFMSAGTSELDQLRATQRDLMFRDSEIALQRRIAIEERLVPTMRPVPGR